MRAIMSNVLGSSAAKRAGPLLGPMRPVASDRSRKALLEMVSRCEGLSKWSHVALKGRENSHRAPQRLIRTHFEWHRYRWRSGLSWESSVAGIEERMRPASAWSALGNCSSWAWVWSSRCSSAPESTSVRRWNPRRADRRRWYLFSLTGKECHLSVRIQFQDFGDSCVIRVSQ